MSNNIIDALVYASISNYLTPRQLGDTGISSIIAPNDATNPGPTYDAVLDNTVIKKACCMNKGVPAISQDIFNTTVKIPIPAEVDVSKMINSETLSKFGYIEKTVKVPVGMCPANFSNGQSSCDNFMKTYCENVKQIYKNQINALNTKYDAAEFTRYSPECACYVDVPDAIAVNASTISPKCYSAGCLMPFAYETEFAKTPCTNSFCSAISNFSNITAGGQVNISPSVAQSCSATSSTGGSGGGTGGTGETGRPATGTGTG